MLKEILVEFFERELKKLVEEISLYKDEKTIWIVDKEISNSAGNLCMHLIGNLNHFIGATLAHSGYVRDRDREFSAIYISRKELMEEIGKTIIIVKEALTKMSASDFEKNFPLEKHGKIVKTDYMLMHLLTHLNYHLGQINYHRRLLS